MANAAMTVEDPHFGFALGSHTERLLSPRKRKEIIAAAQELQKSSSSRGGKNKKNYQAPMKELINSIYHGQPNITGQKLLVEFEKACSGRSKILKEAISGMLDIEFQEVTKTTWNQGKLFYRANGKDAKPITFKRILNLLGEIREKAGVLSRNSPISG